MAPTEPAGAGPALRVVRVVPRDWRTMRDVRLAMLLDAPRAFGATYARDAAKGDEDWRARVGEDAPPAWLAWLGDRPVGTVTLLHHDDLAEDEQGIVAMWVSASARGRGVGRALVEAALAEARARGARRVLLDVADDNGPARALYERAGFRPTGRSGLLPWDASITESELAVDLT